MENSGGRVNLYLTQAIPYGDAKASATVAGKRQTANGKLF